jgi:hypothetical protein
MIKSYVTDTLKRHAGIIQLKPITKDKKMITPVE